MNFSTSAHMLLRSTLALIGIVLAVQAAWVLLAERHELIPIRIPIDQNAANMARAMQDKTKQAASLAIVRGDLWADNAFTYADLLWIDPTVGTDTNNQRIGEALKSIIQTVRYSPHRGDIWLMFAAIADRYKSAEYQPSALLKMSYYTDPNELVLFPLRLNLALRARGVIDDPELQDMIRRDIRVILSRAPALKPALLAAHRSASPQGKAFADRVITEINPSYLNEVRGK